MLDWIVDDHPELPLRLRPLREHWEARGPGMLRFAQQSLPWIEYPTRIEVRLMPPKQGGGGRAVSTTQVELEAVLANPFPQLPEVVRLAWLILSAASGNDTREQIALIPCTLAAGEYVELARCDEPTIQLALSEWVPNAPSTPSSLDLLQWWEATAPTPHHARDAWLQTLPA